MKKQQIIRFYRTPLQEELLSMKVMNNQELISIFKSKKDVTEIINQEVNSRMNGAIENFITALFEGEQGTLKTCSALEFAKLTQNNFKISQVSFLYDHFRQQISQSQPKETFILDEQVFLHGTGSMRLIQEIQSLIETLRKRQNSMILVSVESKYYPENIFTISFETIDNTILGRCKDYPEDHEIRACPYEQSPSQHLIKEAYIRLIAKKSGHYLGFYIIRTDWNNALWLEYEKIKDEFLEQAKNQDFTKLPYEETATKILQDPEAYIYKKTKQLMLYLEKKYPNLSIGEKNLLIEQIKISRGDYDTSKR